MGFKREVGARKESARKSGRIKEDYEVVGKYQSDDVEMDEESNDRARRNILYAKMRLSIVK